jgi:hypothetical protein
MIQRLGRDDHGQAMWVVFGAAGVILTIRPSALSSRECAPTNLYSNGVCFSRSIQHDETISVFNNSVPFLDDDI